MTLRHVAAWGVHLFTASSAPAGILALLAIDRGDAPAAFWWMAYTLAVDAIDGTFARAVGVKQVLPYFDGAKLDDIVDYFTYVIVPAVFLVQMHLVPSALAVPIAALVTVASGYGFAHAGAKTADHFFTGFPSYWNLVVFYLWVLQWSPVANTAIVVAFAIGVFVPIRYVYPSRTPTLRWLTVSLGIIWAMTLCWCMLDLASSPRTIVVWSLAYPVYYLVLSLYLHFRRVNE